MVKLSLEFIKGIFEWGFPIDDYVKFNQITPEQYQEITGKPYRQG
ncbi:XkdX family protein [Limosilactobacillus reuteri]|nr:XkdX family protein [Limosilactobacillus reuteri]MCH9393614.1 XkdX family protein [Limosilactobacillus reuteri]